MPRAPPGCAPVSRCRRQSALQCEAILLRLWKGATKCAHAPIARQFLTAFTLSYIPSSLWPLRLRRLLSQSRPHRGEHSDQSRPSTANPPPLNTSRSRFTWPTTDGCGISSGAVERRSTEPPEHGRHFLCRSIESRCCRLRHRWAKRTFSNNGRARPRSGKPRLLHWSSSRSEPLPTDGTWSPTRSPAHWRSR